VKSINNIIIPLTTGLIALVAGYLIRKYIAEAKINSAEESAKKDFRGSRKKSRIYQERIPCRS